VMHAVAQPHLLERPPGLVAPLLAALAGVDQGQLDVVQGIGSGQQVETLEKKAISVPDLLSPVVVVHSATLTPLSS
jgi:hypothetical protein